MNDHLVGAVNGRDTPLTQDAKTLATLLTERRGDVLIVRVVGEIDLSNAAAIIAELERLVGAADRCVLDCVKLTHISAAGVRSLLETGARHMAEGGRMRLVAPADGVLGRVLHVVSPDPGIPIDSRVDDATERLRE